MHQRTQKTSVSELLVDRQQEADNGLYSCVYLDNQETDIDEVTRVSNGRQARWTALTDRTSYCFYFKCHPSACWNYVGQENSQGLLVLGISDDVVEGHAGSVAAHHDAAQNLCLAFTSLTAGEK